jgi:uncharacterized protein YndB with AHSA1/START domain
MDTTSEDAATMTSSSTAERPSDRELVVARTINGPARVVFEAWTQPDLFKRWWSPKSFPISLLSCELDVRVGGGYRLVYGFEGSTMEFFGRYLEVTPPSRLVWTNDEGPNAQVTTVTFEEAGDTTSVVVHDRYPSKEALDAEIASGSTAGMPEQLAQLDELIAELGRNHGGS